MAGLSGQKQDLPGGTASSSTLPSPMVEITVERLEGIIWSTPIRPTNREELKKKVPFVTAAVEFSGTCPNMKVYMATKFPHSKYPAVESYFASLAEEEVQKLQAGGAEVKKVISTTTQTVGGKQTTTTTTTTITTVQAKTTPGKYREGQYPLVAKWHDDTCGEKLVDSVTYFTNATSDDEAESYLGTLFTNGQKNHRPHLTLTLPMAGEQQRRSILTSMFATCHLPQQKSTFQSGLGDDYNDFNSAVTNSTVASTNASPSSPIHSMHRNEEPFQCRSQEGTNSSPFHDLGSLLDEEGDQGDEGRESLPFHKKEIVMRQDEADVAPVVATQKSKELVASAIAAEPSSAVVGQTDGNNATGAFSPLSWMSCGTSAPEIVELRVRVMPEESDEYDEMDPSQQHLAAAQDLEGVAHLVFLDQIIEEGTTVMDLPLKICQDQVVTNPTLLSTTPTVGAHGFVTLGPNAMLRVRVTILPLGRATGATPFLHPQPSHRPTLHENMTMKTQSLSESAFPFYLQPYSLKNHLIPLMERVYQTQYFQSDRKNAARASSQNADNDEQPMKKGGILLHKFPTEAPGKKKSTKVESCFVGNWRTGESWFNLGLSGTAKAQDTDSRIRREKSRRRRGRPRRLSREKRKNYSLPPASDSSSVGTGFHPGSDESATETEIYTRLL